MLDVLANGGKRWYMSFNVVRIIETPFGSVRFFLAAGSLVCLHMFTPFQLLHLQALDPGDFTQHFTVPPVFGPDPCPPGAGFAIDAQTHVEYLTAVDRTFKHACK